MHRNKLTRLKVIAKASYYKELLKTCRSTESWEFVNGLLQAKAEKLILYHHSKY